MKPHQIISTDLNRTAIQWGVISASKKVREHIEFEEGCSTAGLVARDERGKSYQLKARRRMGGKYGKEVIAGLTPYIRGNSLVQGDRIIISMMDKLFGAVLRPPSYYIRYEKAAQGAEAGEN